MNRDIGAVTSAILVGNRKMCETRHRCTGGRVSMGLCVFGGTSGVYELLGVGKDVHTPRCCAAGSPSLRNPCDERFPRVGPCHLLRFACPGPLLLGSSPPSSLHLFA